ncbi:MAG: 16S rRNA (guanine(966)-N(2))-methyltransferase RsmD [Anaerolineae bacterium]|nr:16S rRNA (guanine(966)-N(2))-methyltransferase RsmD [Anaerolineae bacterium]
MRVIAGTARGRQLRSVKGPGTRPMTNRAKAALFSIIDSHVKNSEFLDLFAGTGQVTIEALSRGAERAVLVEKSAAALRTIQTNLRTTNLEERASLVRADVFRYLERSPTPFDYVFVAPPQYRGWWTQTLYLIDANPGWLYEDGWVIVQINPSEYENIVLENLTLFDQRTYGSVMLCFFARQEDEASEEDGPEEEA